ncbi:ABC transporter permease [Candidatus Woesearchaeota archaeon]|nr:ABC transporter permease [Candidatus Woesearchaeota archaeon]
MIADYLKFSFSNLKSRKLRSYLTMLGIFIGIAAVVSLISLGEGLRYAVSSQFGFLGADLIRVNVGSAFGPPGSSTPSNPLTTDNINQIAKLNGVRMAAGRNLRQVKMTFNGKTSFAMAVSMPDGRERKEIEELIGYSAAKGRMLKDGDRSLAVIGASLADKETFDKEIVPGASATIQGKPFTVAGILKKKGSFVIDGAILLNEDMHRELMGLPKDQYDFIGVRAANLKDVDAVKGSIEKLLRKKRNVKEGEEDFSVETAASAISQIDNVLVGVNIFVFLIAGISLVVGGIGIMNTMYTAVLERTKEIGILKAIGAGTQSIFSLFFLESGILGLLGGIIGIALGVIGTLMLAALGRSIVGTDLFQARFSPLLLLGSLAFSFLLGIIFGVAPALRAAKMHPVDALRYAK